LSSLIGEFPAFGIENPGREVELGIAVVDIRKAHAIHFHREPLAGRGGYLVDHDRPGGYGSRCPAR